MAAIVGLTGVQSEGSAQSEGDTVQTTVDSKPNILFVMTDDMPKDLLNRMPHVSDRIAAQGLTLNNAYVSNSLCCPSRATVLRGQYSHNTGILNNGPPNGGWADFKGFGLEGDTVARWVQSAGYSTGFVGKYFNGYGTTAVPPYWSYWFGGIEAPLGEWKKANENGTVKDYSTDPRKFIDIEREKALGFVDSNTDELSDSPFMLFLWPSEPHLPADDYPDRYANLYTNEPLNPKPSFDEADVSDKPQWVRNLPRITDEDRTTLTNWKRNQLRSLRAVDDAVSAILDMLENRGELANTYVIFTTDNGTSMGEHRYWHSSGAKWHAYEEAANVPFVVRGPGVPAGVSRNHLVLNNDLASTFAEIAGATPPSFVDGRSLLPVWAASPPTTWRTAVLNERPPGSVNPIRQYQAVMTEQYTYVEYGNGEKELYDRSADPYQLQSIHNTASPTLLTDLQEHLQALKGCATASCQEAEDGDGVTDTTAPDVTKAPTQTLTSGSTLGTSTIPVKLNWSATDSGSGVAAYELQQSTDGGAYAPVTLSSATQTSITRQLTPGKTYRFQVRAQDQAGNWSAWRQGPTFKVNLIQESASAISYTGTWSTQSLTSASGGAVKYASATGNSASLNLNSIRNIGWVSTRGSDRGKGEVWLDGAKVSTPDLYASTSQYRKVVYAKNQLNPSVSHSLETRVLGTKNASSSGTRVDQDALVVLSSS